MGHPKFNHKARATRPCFERDLEVQLPPPPPTELLCFHSVNDPSLSACAICAELRGFGIHCSAVRKELDVSRVAANNEAGIKGPFASPWTSATLINGETLKARLNSMRRADS